MTHRPIPIILIGILYLLEPLTKTLIYSALFGVTPFEMVRLEVSQGTALHLFEFYFLFPIAGVAILMVRNWSLYLFFLIQIYVLSMNAPNLVALYSRGSHFYFWTILFFVATNIAYVVYFLVPPVRKTYLDPRMRWWEAQPRYTVALEATLQKIPVLISNLSRSGVFLETKDILEIDQINPLEIKTPNGAFNADVKVIHQLTINEKKGYGLKFQDLNPDSKRILKNYIKHLENLKVPRRPERRNLPDAIKNWAKHLIQTREGLFPEIPRKP